MKVNLCRECSRKVAAYTAGMDGEMLRGVLDARAGTRPLPLQPIRLGVVFAERLGGELRA